MLYILATILLLSFPAFVGASETAAVAEEVKKASALGTLGVDWKLFLAQLVNFGVIFVILWRWVFKPIGSHLEERTTKIEQSLQDAEEIIKEKEEFDRWKSEQLNEVRLQANQIITNAKQEAESLRAEILAKTKTEEQRLKDETVKQLEKERDALMDEAKKDLATLAVKVAERVLGSELKESHHQALAQNAIEQISNSINDNSK